MIFARAIAALSAPLLALAAAPTPCFGGNQFIDFPKPDTNLSEVAAANGGTFPFRYCGAYEQFPNSVGTRSRSIQVIFGVLPAGGFVGPVAAEFAHPTDNNLTYVGNLTIPRDALVFHTNYNFEVLEVASDPDGKNPGIIRNFVNVFV